MRNTFNKKHNKFTENNMKYYGKYYYLRNVNLPANQSVNVVTLSHYQSIMCSIMLNA